MLQLLTIENNLFWVNGSVGMIDRKNRLRFRLFDLFHTLLGDHLGLVRVVESVSRGLSDIASVRGGEVFGVVDVLAANWGLNHYWLVSNNFIK